MRDSDFIEIFNKYLFILDIAEMEKEISENGTEEFASFGLFKGVDIDCRIYKHDLDLKNWHLALLDEKNGVTVIDKNFDILANFPKTHNKKVTVMRCIDQYIVTGSEDKSVKFWNKEKKELEVTITCKIRIKFSR